MKHKVLANYILSLGYKGALLALIGFAGLIGFSALSSSAGPRIFVVQSGSMEPAIATGSLVVVTASSDYNKGDIISFRPLGDRNTKAVVTHRVIDKRSSDQFVVYSTKGDANKAPDMQRVNSDQVLGKVVLNIPFAGYLVNFAKTTIGFITLIVVPATIIVYKELVVINQELRNMVKKRLLAKKKKVTKKTTAFEPPKPVDVEDDVALINVGKAFSIFLLLALVSGVGIGHTSASFSDQQTITQNSISTGWWEDPPKSSVIMSEVMWMGSSQSTADEWIELLNTTDQEISLDGWFIEAAGAAGSSLTLTGTIPAGGYFLVSNYPTTGSAVSDQVAADQVSASLSLANDGEQLVLKDGGGNIIDQTPPGRWPAGVDGPPRWQSMERNDSEGDGSQPPNWHTCSVDVCNDGQFWDSADGDNFGTPKAENHSVDTSNGVSEEQSENGQIDHPSSTADQETSTDQTVSMTGSASPEATSSANADQPIQSSTDDKSPSDSSPDSLPETPTTTEDKPKEPRQDSPPADEVTAQDSPPSVQDDQKNQDSHESPVQKE